jgi:hypothetical protein
MRVSVKLRMAIEKLAQQGSAATRHLGNQDKRLVDLDQELHQAFQESLKVLPEVVPRRPRLHLADPYVRPAFLGP